MNFFHWLTPWEPSVTVVVATVLMTIIYARGCRYIAVAPWQKALFAAGVISLYIVSHTQFDYYAQHEFFMHRLQHSVLHHIAPILLVLSHPLEVLAAGLPLRVRGIVEGCAKSRFMRAVLNPVFVTASFVGLIYLWLIPSVHFVAMLDWRLYRVMNWSMIVNGLMFWGLALGPSYKPHPLSAAARILMMLVVIPAQIIAGAVIFYASTELYPLYSLCGRAFGGVGAMTDQQIGALMLWIMGSMMSVIGILIVAMREFTVPRRRDEMPQSLFL